MGQNRNTCSFVKHPRFGARPVPSAHEYTREEIEQSHWRYSSVRYFPETAIPANVDKQNYAIYPRRLYVDIEEQCRNCGRAFIFFALEQKHWFEELGFWIDAHCVRCIDCRRKEQEIKRLQSTYQDLVAKAERDPRETRVLKNVALELFQLGFISDRSKVDSIR